MENVVCLDGIKSSLMSYLETESAQKSLKSQRGDERFFKVVIHYFCELRGFSRLSEIQVEDLQRFHIWLSPEQKSIGKGPWMDTTIAHYCQTLKAVFNKAERLDRIVKNPAKWWQVPRGESRERRPMTRLEFEKLCQAVPVWFLPILKTLRLTGARGASLAMLEWPHVDFVNNRITLSSRKGGRKRVKQITVPMSQELKSVLWQIRPQDLRGPVFLDPDGQPITPQLISTIGSQGKFKAGLDGVVLYGLRHALATDLVEAGVSPDVIRRLMGHSSLNQQMTYQKYASLKPLEEAITKIRGSEMMQ